MTAVETPRSGVPRRSPSGAGAPHVTSRAFAWAWLGCMTALVAADQFWLHIT